MEKGSASPVGSGDAVEGVKVRSGDWRSSAGAALDRTYVAGLGAVPAVPVEREVSVLGDDGLHGAAEAKVGLREHVRVHHGALFSALGGAKSF